MACNACGKAKEIGPLAIVERISRNRQPAFATRNQQPAIKTTIDASDVEVTEDLLDAMEKAREILPRLPGMCLGKLQLESDGQPDLDIEPVAGGEESWVFPKQVSALPTFEGVDEAMISLLIAEYGEQGTSLKVHPTLTHRNVAFDTPFAMILFSIPP